ncbi:MAG: DMT family transporter [Boseongicola sp. SB0662_bin_57]|nr:DMT family transporter [Boseongicola sp. SB0662_bin_57]
MPVDSPRTGVAVAFAGALLLSLDTLLLRGIDGHFLTVAFWRGLLMGLSAMLFMLLLRRRRHPAFGPVRSPGGLAVAGLYGLASVFFVLGVAFTSVANLLVIVATAPLWAALASSLFLREVIASSTWVAMACGLAGVCVVVLPGLGASHAAGDAFALATALCMAGAFTMSRRVQEPLGLAPSLGGGMSAIVLAPFVPAFGFETRDQTVLMALEGAALMPVALGLVALAPRYLPAPQVGLFLLLETALGPLWVWLFIGETPSANAALGGVVVVSALAVHSLLCLRSLPRDLRTRNVPDPD